MVYTIKARKKNHNIDLFGNSNSQFTGAKKNKKLFHVIFLPLNHFDLKYKSKNMQVFQMIHFIQWRSFGCYQLSIRQLYSTRIDEKFNLYQDWGFYFTKKFFFRFPSGWRIYSSLTHLLMKQHMRLKCSYVDA